MDKKRKDFLERVMALARETLAPEERHAKITSCRQYDAREIDRYVRDMMRPEEASLFEAHCSGCLACAALVLRAHEMRSREQDAEENTYLINKGLALLEGLRQQQAAAPVSQPGLANTLRIVLDQIQGALRLIQTTGAILAPAPVVRGSDLLPESGKTIQIVQEFEHPYVSVQTSLVRDETNRVQLDISLFDKTIEDCMPGIVVALRRGDEVISRSVSNERGMVSILLDMPMVYEIDLVKDSVILGHICLEMHASVV